MTSVSVPFGESGADFINSLGHQNVAIISRFFFSFPTTVSAKKKSGK